MLCRIVSSGTIGSDYVDDFVVPRPNGRCLRHDTIVRFETRSVSSFIKHHHSTSISLCIELQWPCT